MKILSKNNLKDYWDYLQSINGIDPMVIYDRRKFTVLANEWFYQRLFSDRILEDDKPLMGVMRYRCGRYNEEINAKWNPKDKVMCGVIRHYILQCGKYNYYFEVERYKDADSNKPVINYSLLFKKKATKRLSDAPMSFSHATLDKSYFRGVDICPYSDPYDNPILRDTFVAKLVSAEEIWDNLYNYLSSLNEKEIVDNRTNDEHIESHGFDKKTSFRNVK